jgi:hypothetical protein
MDAFEPNASAAFGDHLELSPAVNPAAVNGPIGMVIWWPEEMVARAEVLERTP